MDDDKKCVCTDDCECKCNDVNCGCCEKKTDGDDNADLEAEQEVSDDAEA